MYIHITILSLVIFHCSAQFTDDLQSFEPPAECIGEDKFTCVSGACIEQSQYCDGRLDCDDGTDENFCADHQANAALCNQTHQYLCKDQGHCISHKMICDGAPDCNDGSDEKNCTGDFTPSSATCKGYQCNDGTCISKLWVCDGRYDCPDRSDEYREDMCRSSLKDHSIIDGSFCFDSAPLRGYRSYKCLDGTYCLPSEMMCDGIKDCHDGSDEGDFCKNWSTMCNDTTFNCVGNNTDCFPDRTGPVCQCYGYTQYNNVTQRCEDVDQCKLDMPLCSHHCINYPIAFKCTCDEGYKIDKYGYLCYAQGPEAMLFFSTRNEIKFLKIKSKQLVTVATGIKEAHGVSYDGQYLYWVETAQGHQSIIRAHLEDFEETKHTVASFGLEDPGDISVDWLGKNIYFSDAVRGTITACSLEGTLCATIPADTNHPKFVTVNPRTGIMYWADYHKHPVIMSARMDGAQHEVVADKLETFVTGLTLDAPNNRLYFVDRTIKVLMLTTKNVYPLFEEPFHRPYSIAVFENTVFWSDWTSMSIQTVDKLHGTKQSRNILLTLDQPVFGMHMYHPAMMPTSTNPCAHHLCSHLCFITSNTTHVCGCPDGMTIVKNICSYPADHRSKYIVVAEGPLFTRLDYINIGNPEGHTTNFAIGRVQAMAYDNVRDTLYIYDGQRRSIDYINMTDFSLGITHAVIYQGLDNVVDMDYDYASDTLYILDAGRQQIEVVSLRTRKRALVYKFDVDETPISFCVLPDYGTMLVAVMGSETHNIQVDSISLDGSQRETIAKNNFKGPHIRLRYAQYMDNVFVSDEGNGVINFMHPGGTGRDTFRELSTTVTSLAITDSYVFWTDRRTPRLFWSSIHETTHRVRRLGFSLFPNNTQLLIQATTAAPSPTNPLLNHPCLISNPCTDVCVQSSTSGLRNQLTYKCLCPPGYYMEGGKCTKVITCGDQEFFCRKSNKCIEQRQVCDGKPNCVYLEDEMGCKAKPPPAQNATCDETEFQCNGTTICLPRLLVCDSRPDCPDGSDELHDECEAMQCFDTEFKCASRRSCIPKTWKCDGDDDCGDGTDELDCESTTCKPGYYQCRDRECIEMKKRCDRFPDCFDYSDEEDCDEVDIVPFEEAQLPHCLDDYEIACELNKTICIPVTAQCNMIVDCPGGTDENNCDFRCTRHGLFACKQQLNCVGMKKVCNGKNDCDDGSDETPDACLTVNKTSHLYPPVLFPKDECLDGYLCDNGECIENHQMCNGKQDCADSSDEGAKCTIGCEFNACEHTCTRSPRGPHCRCLPGFSLAEDGRTCEDNDECATDPCSQNCFNTPGSFLCSCHHGYALRADRRSCKATRGIMSVLYVSNNTVRSTSFDGHGGTEFTDPSVELISDLDVNIRRNMLYVTANAGKLMEINQSQNIITVTNIGAPTQVAVDWVTGNVYFVDSLPGDVRIRVCNVQRNRCAKLQRLPSDASVPSLIVDPSARLMFYCVRRGLESVVWSARLSGHDARDLTTVKSCTGLTVDSFLRHLYVAESDPAQITRMNYTGDEHKIMAEHPQMQPPHVLSLFEDHIYHLVAHTSRLSRCRLIGSKHCEPFIYRMFDATSFVIRHESVQRDDLKDLCEDTTCENVCVLDEEGTKCVCDDGTFATGGVCNKVPKEELPLFNGVFYEHYKRPHEVSITLIVIVLVLLASYLGMFLFYHFVYKPRRNASAYMEVRYQPSTAATGTTLSYEPAVEITSDGSAAHEFVNPLQYVRSLMRHSFRSPPKPIGTAGLTIDVGSPPQEDLSDTESDLDDRERLISFLRK